MKKGWDRGEQEVTGVFVALSVSEGGGGGALLTELLEEYYCFSTFLTEERIKGKHGTNYFLRKAELREKWKETEELRSPNENNFIIQTRSTMLGWLRKCPRYFPAVFPTLLRPSIEGVCESTNMDFRSNIC
jgi:hypothetical protein